MSEPEGFDPEDYEGVQPKMATLPRSEVRRLEKKAKEAEQMRAEVEQLRREQGFLRAGIPESGIGRLFMKAYDGPDDLEAIKAAAVEYGVLQPSSGEQEQIDRSLQGHDAAREAASGAPPRDAGVDRDAELRRIAAQFKGPLQAADAKEAIAKFLHEQGASPLDLPGVREQLRR